MKTAIFLTAALFAATGLAMAHSGATGIVKERMDGMGTVARAAKTIDAAVKSAPADRDAIAAAAGIIADEGGARMLARFPDQSLSAVSEALPAIWQDWERFSELAVEQSTAATALRDAALDTERADADLEVAFRALRQTCANCHADFRAKK